ncbi:MAG: hypothetical protein V5A83_02500 [Candidatus Bipolaricaulota bacterium]|nr:hypothetical protein [Candidatus Bipolaricaulota bacterium]
MLSKKKERIYEKLNGQISELADHVPYYFIELGESLFFMLDKELYEVKYDDIASYLRHTDAGKINRRTVFALRNIYKYFRDYIYTERGRALLYFIGWTKANILYQHREKFERVLEIGALNLDDITMYAYGFKKKDLVDNLEDKQPLELWRDIYEKTHMEIDLDDPFKGGIVLQEKAIHQCYGFEPGEEQETGPLVIKEMVEKEFSDDLLLEILSYLREISSLYYSLYLKLSMKVMRDLTRPGILKELEEMAFYREAHDFQAIMNDQELIREMLQKSFMNSDELSEITGVDVSNIQEWLQDETHNTTGTKDQSLFSLRDARKTLLIEKYLDAGKKKESAKEKVEEILEEERSYKIMVPYKEMSEKALEVVDDINEGQILRRGGGRLSMLREKGLADNDVTEE